MDAYSWLSAHWVWTLLRLVRGSPIVITSPKTSSGSRRRSSSARQSLEAASWEGDSLCGLARLGEFGDGEARAEELDVATGTGQTDPADAGTCRVRDDRDGRVQGQAKPGGEQHGAGGVRGAFDRNGGDRVTVNLVQDRGELDAPVRQPGPGEVGVAGLVRVPDVLQRRPGVRPRSPSR
jgi:hypothetical protein